MKMRSLLLSILLVCGLIYGGCRLYQTHLSSDLRGTLIAAADPTASDAELHAYLRRARFQVRTERDAEIFEKIATAVQLSDGDRKQVLLDAQRMADFATWDSKESSVCRQMIRTGMKKLAFPKARVVREQCKKQLAADKAERQWEQAQRAVYQKNMDRAQALFRDFRNELGLPPVENQ
jgi:hypothetical protein